MRPELQDIVDEAARLIGGAATLEDRQYGLIAFSTQHGAVDAVREASILQRTMPPHVTTWFEQFGFATSPVPVRTPADPELGILPRICFPARCHGSTYGYLWVLDATHELTDPEVAHVCELAEHAGVYLAQQTRQHEQDRLLVADLLGADVEGMDRAAMMLADAGRIPRDSAVVSIVVATRDTDIPAGRRLNPSRLPAHVLAAEGRHGVTLVAAVPRADRTEQVRRLARNVCDLYAERVPERSRAGVVAGVGSIEPSVLRARESWLHARTAARVATEGGAPDPVLLWDELGIHRLLATTQDRALRSALLHPAVERLLREASPEIVRTVREYLDRSGRAQDAADALSIHRQTLYYRLEKAERIMGVSLGDGRQRTAVHAALLLLPVIDRAGTAGQAGPDGHEVPTGLRVG